MSDDEVSELHLKYRPKTLDEIHGQPEATAVVRDWLESGKVPHSILLTGPSGVGKTTIARILRRKLGCRGIGNFCEMNCAEARGIDAIRAIQTRMGASAMGGSKCRMWLMDECHKWSGDAMSACLKMLEDTPRHVYFVLATTDPEKLLPAIRSRCTTLALKPLPGDDVRALLERVAKAEGIKVGKVVLDQIIETADGGARLAVNLLNKVRGLKTDQEKLDAVLKGDVKKQGIDLARIIIKPSSKWPEVSVILKDLQGEPEDIRRVVLGYAASVVVNGGPGRAFLVLEEFERNFYDSGKAGLVRACRAVFNGQ